MKYIGSLLTGISNNARATHTCYSDTAHTVKSGLYVDIEI
jgi:hypothetical protein